MILQLLFRIILLSWPMIAGTQVQAQVFPKLNCATRCGSVDIPFPFGIGEGCYIDDWFAIDCNKNKPFIRRIQLEVLEISLDEGTIRVNHAVVKNCSDLSDDIYESQSGILPTESPFVYSQEGNRFTLLGCNSIAYMTIPDFSIVGGCFSNCDNKKKTEENGCYGIKCCQTKIPSSLKVFSISMSALGTNAGKGCKHAFLVDQKWFETSLKNPEDVKQMSHVPVVLDWRIFNTSFNQLAANQQGGYKSTSTCEVDADFRSYITGNSSATVNYSVAANSSTTQLPVVQCRCHPGFDGNPYPLQGCQDIDECIQSDNPCKRSGMPCQNLNGTYHCLPISKSKVNMVALGLGAGLGSFFLIFIAWWLYIVIKRRKAIKRKQQFFKQNGGLLLREKLSSLDGSGNSVKMFNSKELDKATDHFNVNRILGEGGQGTVYKGMLSDGRIIAVKKSKVADEGKVEFINEIIILSQIIHRNVVKLLGCCLETEFPLLVYEFIPNGTLFQYLHHQSEELLLTWSMRLRIATEVAGALWYLHSATSSPIYHRDIKSSNILLDEKFRAKVADFGTSKSISIDQTHVTTKVQGTFGYLDPEFFQSNQFTDKSDVYSFGVVLVELLTGQKPISSTRSEDNKSLVAAFFISIQENCLHNIIDAEVLKQGQTDDIMAVANLARRCLNLNGKKIPTMKEVAVELERIQASQKGVAIELEGIQASQKDDGVHQTYQEIELSRTEVSKLGWDSGCSSTFEHVSSSEGIEPLLTS